MWYIPNIIGNTQKENILKVFVVFFAEHEEQGISGSYLRFLRFITLSPIVTPSSFSMA